MSMGIDDAVCDVFDLFSSLLENQAFQKSERDSSMIEHFGHKIFMIV